MGRTYGIRDLVDSLWTKGGLSPSLDKNVSVMALGIDVLVATTKTVFAPREPGAIRISQDSELRWSDSRMQLSVQDWLGPCLSLFAHSRANPNRGLKLRRCPLLCPGLLIFSFGSGDASTARRTCIGLDGGPRRLKGSTLLLWEGSISLLRQKGTRSSYALQARRLPLPSFPKSLPLSQL